MLRRLLSVIYSSIAAWAFSLKQTEWSREQKLRSSDGCAAAQTVHGLWGRNRE